MLVLNILAIVAILLIVVCVTAVIAACINSSIISQKEAQRAIERMLCNTECEDNTEVPNQCLRGE